MTKDKGLAHENSATLKSDQNDENTEDVTPTEHTTSTKKRAVDHATATATARNTRTTRSDVDTLMFHTTAQTC